MTSIEVEMLAGGQSISFTTDNSIIKNEIITCKNPFIKHSVMRGESNYSEWSVHTVIVYNKRRNISWSE